MRRRAYSKYDKGAFTEKKSLCTNASEPSMEACIIKHVSLAQNMSREFTTTN